MALTPFQKLELNKRVDRIFHAPTNASVRGHEPEIAFVADMTGDIECIHSSIKDAVSSLKQHDKMFQNMRSNVVYWTRHTISSKVTPMSFILMGKAFDAYSGTGDIVDVDNIGNFEKLCEYLKLYHARCRCILLFMDYSYEELERRKFYITDRERALQSLNPFIKYRLLIITKDKMLTGSELMIKVVNIDGQE
ncbi:MAG: hypothetical protein K2N73_04255 [Lachnospiraceae bacterium]|nr:hypothetical protein [Lachnospiraceae bacterium]